MSNKKSKSKSAIVAERRRKYAEILKLHKLLTEAGIKHQLGLAYDGYQIIVYTKDHSSFLCDAIEHNDADCPSYGCEADKIEIEGGLTAAEQEEDNVLGWLTAEEVLKRFKYCYEHDTDVYEEGK